MSNGDWLCRKCVGPDGHPWRNGADKVRCHKFKVAKGSCFLRKAAAGGGSPTTSARQQGKAASNGTPVPKTFAQAMQNLNKLVAKFVDPSKKQLEEENKKLRQELLAAKAGGAGGDKEPEANEDETELDKARQYIRQLTGVPGAEVPLAKY